MLRTVRSLLCIALLCFTASVARAEVGQWVWSTTDAKVLQRARKERPDLVAGVHVGEFHWRGTAEVSLRMSPRSVPNTRAAVIRLNDSFHGAWEKLSSEQVAAELQAALGRLVPLVEGGGEKRTIQIDYDCPVRRLPLYAEVLRRLRAEGGALHGRTVWITSLVSHLRDASYGPLFRGVVDGHVLQLFDAGVKYSPEKEADVTRILARAEMPFQLGLGAYERVRDGSTQSSHGDWFLASARIAQSKDYRGTWVFAAGHDWRALVRSVP